MDESHRLKPMKPGYNEALFNEIYKETSALRKKLAFDIDARKFGVDYKEVLSCFDVKMLYVFNKYHDDEKVKGYVINALRTFKYRIIKNSYLPKNEIHKTHDISDMFELQDDSVEHLKEENPLLELSKNYLKSILSEDAYFIFEIDLNPPPYILARLQEMDTKKIPKPTAELVAEFLGINDNDYAIEYIENLRKEVKQAINNAKYHFNGLKLS